MKSRETKSWEQDAGRSQLVRAGLRWLSFARRVSRGRRRVAAADPLAFIESLYGGKFKTVEGGAFALDKVYRTIGGGLFVSETRLSLSLHPRFDLRLVNIAAGGIDSQVFRETRTVLGHLLHTPLTGRAPRRVEWQGGLADAVAPSLTVQKWNVSPTVAGAYVQAFGYVAVRGPRGQEPQPLEPTLTAPRVERLVRDGMTTSPSVEASRPTAALSPVGLRQTSNDLRQHYTHVPRQEFVSLLLNTYLPAAVSREVESARKTGELLSAPPRHATAQGETGRRFAQPVLIVMPGQQFSQWTYAEQATRAELLHLLPPASLLTGLPVIAQTLLAGGGDGTRVTAHGSSERAPTLSLQLMRPQAAPTGTREGSAVVDTTGHVDQSLPHQPTSTRDVLSSNYTFVGRAPSTVVAGSHAVNTTVFARPGFELLARMGHEQAAARRRDASSIAAQAQALTHGLSGRSIEFVPHTSVAELLRAAPWPDVTSQIPSGLAPNDIPAQRTTGAGSFRFAAGMTRRAAKTPAARTSSPTAAMTLRLALAAETEREVKETRAARPEGMALELIRHRREQVLQLPQPGYVFTQPPARAQLEERQVITKASREEIVEVVRREVRSLAASTPAVAPASRADLAGLADEIYSTLARRLLVEKERLGRF